MHNSETNSLPATENYNHDSLVTPVINLDTLKQSESEQISVSSEPGTHLANKLYSSSYIIGVLIVLLICLIDSSAFPSVKSIVSSVSPSVLIAIRFTVAAVICIPFLRNLNARLVRDGTITGLLFFGMFAAEGIGLETMSANKAAFTFALSVVFVILFEVLLGRSISTTIILASTLAFIGIVIMSWDSKELLNGEIWMIVCAIIDSVYIIVLEQFVQRHPPLQLAAVGFWIPAILGLLWAGSNIFNEIELIKANLSSIVYVSVICTAIFAYLETTAQRWVPANQVAVLRTLEPVIAGILSFWFLGETFNTFDFIGASMVLAAMILVVVPIDKHKDSLASSVKLEEES